MIISTADSYKYEWVRAPRNKDSVIVEMKTEKRAGPVHVALTENRSATVDKMYRITIGDSDNTVTWIGRGKHDYGIQLTSARTPDILSKDQWHTFWFSWERNVISLGKGHLPNNNTLLKWRIDKKMKIQHLGFASGWGSHAEFRVWNFNDEAGYSQVLHLETPKSVVPGSEWGELLVSGGLALPVIANSDQNGGLSQALSSLTTLLSLQHLGSKANETLKQSAMQNLPGHIQTILSYRKPDNSFSEHQMLGSHKSTVAILEMLTKVQNYFNIDPDLIQGIKRWVQLRQEDDGSFLPLPADVKLTSYENDNKIPENKIRDNETLSFEHIVEMTAETIITLFEIGIESDADSETLQKAKIFLENGLPKIESSTTIATVALALVLVRSATATWAIEKLRNASTTEDGEFGWPHPIPKRDAADWLYESEVGKTLKEPVVSTMEDYKASIYALMTFCLIRDLRFAESVTKYLFYRSHMLDRHSELLYPVVKAFTMYDSLAKDKHRALTVSLATSGMELTDTLELKPEKQPQLLHLPSLPTKVFVYATGAGCATVQGKTTYSTYLTKSRTPLLDLWSAVVQEILPDRSSVEEIEGKLPMLKIKTCFRWKGTESSGVLRMEISLFSGFELASAPPTLLDLRENILEMQHGYHGNNIWFIFANITNSCPICVQYLARSVFVISSLRPAYARVYPASREDLAAETFFHTKNKSNLLKGITDDDLITWFGSNGTAPENAFYDSKCAASKKDERALESLDKNISYSPKKVQNLTIVTYSININQNANSSEENVKTQWIIEPTAIPLKSNSTHNTPNNTIEVRFQSADEIILQLQNATANSTEDKEKSSKNQFKKLLKIKSIVNEKKTKKITKSKPLEIVTSTPIPTASNSDPQQKELIVDMNVSPPKHINTDKQVFPVKFLEKPKDDDEKQVTFAPEEKDDKYILLDKEELWGMLKEVVSDEIRKSSEIMTHGRKSNKFT